MSRQSAVDILQADETKPFQTGLLKCAGDGGKGMCRNKGCWLDSDCSGDYVCVGPSFPVNEAGRIDYNNGYDNIANNADDPRLPAPAGNYNSGTSWGVWPGACRPCATGSEHGLCDH